MGSGKAFCTLPSNTSDAKMCSGHVWNCTVADAGEETLDDFMEAFRNCSGEGGREIKCDICPSFLKMLQYMNGSEWSGSSCNAVINSTVAGMGNLQGTYNKACLDDDDDKEA